MPITDANLVQRLSGGSANSNANASLGGVMSSTVVSSAVDALFDAVSAAEALAGSVEHRCIYVTNANGTDTMTNLKVYISANTPSPGTDLAIAVGAAAIDANETATANEAAVPAGVTFSAPATAGAGLVIGNLGPGQRRAIWLRRTVSPGAAALANDTCSLGYSLETT